MPIQAAKIILGSWIRSCFCRGVLSYSAPWPPKLHLLQVNFIKFIISIIEKSEHKSLKVALTSSLLYGLWWLIFHELSFSSSESIAFICHDSWVSMTMSLTLKTKVHKNGKQTVSVLLWWHGRKTQFHKVLYLYQYGVGAGLVLNN